MLLVCLVSLLLAAGVFLATKRFRLVVRVAAASVAFALPVVLAVSWVVHVGDHAAPGSTLVEESPK